MDLHILKVEFICDFSSFREFWISGKALDTLKFEVKNKVNITICYLLGEDKAWDPAISESISQFINNPIKKCHLRFKMYPLERKDDKAKLLSAVVQGFKQLRTKKTFFDVLKIRGEPLGHVAMMKSTKFVYDRTDVLPNRWDDDDPIKIRVYRIKHPNMEMALEAGIKLGLNNDMLRHSCTLKLRCVELPPETGKMT